MQNNEGNLFTRDDTLFGVCEALGEDLGFNPLWLRVALPLLLFWNPVATIGAYLAAGVVILASRLLFPNPRMKVAAEIVGPAAEPAVSAEEKSEPLPLAA